jgi:hypothetical protein
MVNLLCITTMSRSSCSRTTTSSTTRPATIPPVTAPLLDDLTLGLTQSRNQSFAIDELGTTDDELSTTDDELCTTDDELSTTDDDEINNELGIIDDV